MIKDLEGRLQSLRSEHGLARDREEQRQRENAELNSRLGEADKVSKGPSIYDVCKIFGIFDPLPPLSAFGTDLQY